MIFGGGQIFFCALIFALHFSTLNAFYLNNGNEYGNVAVSENYMGDKECNGCVGYKCKLNDGKIIEGKDCLKNVVKFCGISKLDESMLKNVVQEKVYSYKGETYFVYSCQDNKNANDKMEDQMNVKMDQRRVKRDDKYDEDCDYFIYNAPSENADVAKKREYVDQYTKCIFEYLDRNSLKSIEEAQNELNDVKMAAEDILKAVDYAKKANEIMKKGEYFNKKAEEIGQKAENFSTIISEFDKMLKTLNESLIDIKKKCADYNETAKACFYTTINCTIEQYNTALESCRFPYYVTDYKAKEYLSKSKELMVPIDKIKSEAEKVLMEANVALTAHNGQELAKEAKQIGEKAKMEAKKSKEIGENSNKTANLAIEIGIEAKMAANESMKIGNEANQKIMEVEKLAKDSKKLAEKNQKEGDKTEAENQKLKSNLEKIGCKFGIFGILLFAYTFLSSL